MKLNLRCLFVHDYQGCTCSRCGDWRNEQHDWQGCKCVRCGEFRNENHDWEVLDCLQHCRCCGAKGDVVHEWEGCACKKCHLPRHDWQDGACARCGQHCDHPEMTASWKVVPKHSPALAATFGVCSICGILLNKSAPARSQHRPGTPPTRAPCSSFVSTEGFRDDPRWKAVRECWLILTGERTSSPDWRELWEWRNPVMDSGVFRPPSLAKRHANALEALVGRGQLDAEVAECIRIAFNEGMLQLFPLPVMTCYLTARPRYHRHDVREMLRLPAESATRKPLTYLWCKRPQEQARTLLMMAERVSIAATTIQRVLACITRDIASLRGDLFLEEFLSGNGAAARAAGRIVFELLLPEP